MIVILIEFLWIKSILVGLAAVPTNVKFIDSSDIQTENLWFPFLFTNLIFICWEPIRYEILPSRVHKPC